MIAVGNRVFLRRCGSSFLSHRKLCHFVSSSFEGRVLACASIHRPRDHVLLSFPFLLDSIHEFFGRPFRKGIAFGDLSAKVKSSKGGHITSAVVLVEGPVGRSDLSFQQDGLRCFNGGAMEKRTGVILMVLKGGGI